MCQRGQSDGGSLPGAKSPLPTESHTDYLLESLLQCKTKADLHNPPRSASTQYFSTSRIFPWEEFPPAELNPPPPKKGVIARNPAASHFKLFHSELSQQLRLSWQPLTCVWCSHSDCWSPVWAGSSLLAQVEKFETIL